MVKKLIPGDLYRHPNGKVYQIRELAKHADTGEEMVVYQQMTPPFPVLVRSLSVFMKEMAQGEVHLSGQQPISTTETTEKLQPSSVEQYPNHPISPAEETKTTYEPLDEEYVHQALLNGQAEKKLSGKMAKEEIARQGFLAILDAESFRDKRRIFMGLEPYLNSLQISNIAVALDIVLEEGTDRQHYETILHCLETFEKYEGGRLRS
jgi:hypothetical protein